MVIDGLACLRGFVGFSDGGCFVDFVGIPVGEVVLPVLSAFVFCLEGLRGRL